MVLCSLFAGITCLCAWLSVPALDIAFTMQTFAVFLTLGVLGGKWGTVSIGIYLLLGAVGLPVFSGFQGGPGVLLGVTGGFLWGFLVSGLVYWALEGLSKPAAMGAGLLACYLCGCLWFRAWAGETGFWLAAAKCVLPYLIPDGAKLILAFTLSRRLGSYVK